MKKTLLAFSACLALIACSRNTEQPVDQNPELGRILTLSSSNQTIRSNSTTRELESNSYGYEVGGKVKWYIGKKYYSGGNKYCKSGFGLCKGSGGPYIKEVKAYSDENQNVIRSNNAQDVGVAMIETSITLYENFIKVTLPYSEAGFTEQEFIENEVFENINSLYLENELFKSVTVLRGKYKIHTDTSGKKYFLAKYTISK